MKKISFALVVFGLISCAARPLVSGVNKYAGESADARAEDADDCHDGEIHGQTGSGDAGTTGQTNGSGTGDAGTSTNGNSGTPSQETGKEPAGEVKVPDPKPTTQVPTTQIPPDSMVPPSKDPVPTDRQSKIKAMLAAKRMVSEYTVMDANSWGTSKDKRIELFIAVDASGKGIVPSGIRNPEAKGDLDASKDQMFETDSMHSVMKICNQSKATIRLHAESGLPFGHSAGNIAKGACTIYLLKNANNIADNKTWDHIIGEQLPIFFKVTKIKPDGSEI